MRSKFSVYFFSDNQYEYMTAEILYEGKILCQINQDKRMDSMEVEFFYDQYILSEQPEFKFLISDFLSLIEEVKNELCTYR